MRTTSRYGWTPDLPNPGDKLLRFRRDMAAPVNDVPIDWRPELPDAYNQGSEGSCTAHGIIGAVQFCQKKQGLPVVMMSRNFLYFNERAREGTIDQDAGAQIRDGILSLIVEGVCPEDQWLYDTNTWAEQPPQRCYDAAVKHEAMIYQRVDNTIRAYMLAALALGPVIAGFSVAASFESSAVAKSGIYTPLDSEEIVGGHCVLVVGNDPVSDRYIVRNSWGTGWGMNGHFTVPRPVFEDGDVADDFWRLESVS